MHPLASDMPPLRASTHGSPRASVEGEECPSEDALWAVAEGTLPDAARDEINEHLDHCATCRAVVVGLVRAASPPEPPRTSPAPGHPWAERYLVRARLGRGGMGVVHAAWDRVLERDVALKVLRRDRGPLDRAHAARLLRESRAMARLRHPNVVTIYDVGTWQDRIYLAMELMEGGTLRQWASARPRSEPELLTTLLAAGEGLAAAHAAGLVHRDFKPDNVLLDAEGHPKVADFGLARERDATEASFEASTDDGEAPPSSSALTRSGAAVGTPRYMAPEQRRGETVDDKADVFAFCVVVHEAVLGSVPDPERSGTRRQRRGGRSSRLLAVLREGLHEDPRRRPSLRILLDRLAVLAAPRRRVGPIALALGVGTAVGTAVVLSPTTQDPASTPTDPCAAARAALDEAWSETERERLRDAWGAGGARRPWPQLERALDGRATDLGRAYERACEAEPADAEDTALRLACLELQRLGWEAVLALVAEADPSAAEAIDAQPSLRSCDEPRRLAQRNPVPDDPETRERVEQIRRAAASLRTLRAAGHYARAREGFEPLEEQARRIGFAPLRAEMAYELGVTLSMEGDGPRGASLMKEAAQVAAGSRHDVLAAEAWTQLIHTSCEELHDYAAAREYRGHAEAAVARLGDSPGAEAARARLAYYDAVLAWREGRHEDALAGYADAIVRARRVDPELQLNAMEAKGLVLVELGRAAEAIDLQREVLELRIDLYGAHHPFVAEGYSSVGLAFFHAGRHHEALEHVRRSRELKIATLGAQHPTVAHDLHLEAHILSELGEHDHALRLAQQARRITEAARGYDHAQTAVMCELEGTVLLGAERNAAAATRFEEALGIYERTLGADAPAVIFSRLQLAQALADTDPQRAADLGQQTVAAYVRLHSEDHVRVINARTVVGEILLDAGRPDEALAMFEPAIQNLGPKLTTGHRGALRFLYVKALVASGDDSGAAARELRLARAELAAANESFDYIRPIVDEWLAEHPRLAEATATPSPPPPASP